MGIGFPMFYYLGLALKVWMLVDAVRRKAEIYWFLVILAVPFGEVIYFFVVKIDDYGRVRSSLAKQLAIKTGASVKELRYQLKSTPSVANQLALATALFDRKETEEARELYQAVLVSHPKEKAALHGLGLCLSRQGQHVEATEAFKRVLDLDLSYLGYASWRELAKAFFLSGQKEQALECVRELLKRDGRIEHKALLAEYLLDQGAQEEARRLLADALEEHRHSPRYVQRANGYAARRAKELLKTAG